MIALVLLYVGAVLIINGLAMLGRIAPREAAIMNIFTGAVSLFVSAHSLSGYADQNAMQNAAFGLLFGFTYLWVAYNSLTNQDGRGLGWFSLFVAISAVPIFFFQWHNAYNTGDKWLAFNWLVWAILWGGFFFLHIFDRKKEFVEPVAYFTIGTGILTAWLPGILLLTQHMPR
jgi:hypothetical protein